MHSLARGREHLLRVGCLRVPVSVVRQRQERVRGDHGAARRSREEVREPVDGKRTGLPVPQYDQRVGLAQHGDARFADARSHPCRLPGAQVEDRQQVRPWSAVLAEAGGEGQSAAGGVAGEVLGRTATGKAHSTSFSA